MAYLDTVQLYGILAIVVCAGIYLLYRAALPHPIPGIPYNIEASKRLAGDWPEIIEYRKQHGDFIPYFRELAIQLDSPIIQMFVRPFANPWVIVSDYHEMRDICTRRTKEFDRSAFMGEMFAAILPHNQIRMSTGEEWKAHRRLMHDTMSSSFLSEVVAPGIHHNTSRLLQLWKEKERLAPGRLFDPHEDVYKSTLETIWTAAFGTESGSTAAQLQHLSGFSKIELPAEIDKPTKFPTTTDPPGFSSILTLTHSMDIATNSPLPAIHMRLAISLTPRLRAAEKYKNETISRRLHEAAEKFSDPSIEEKDSHDGTRCALDLIVQKEMQMAKKDQRPPQIETLAIRDELFGFLLAGFETTSTTILWALKLLTSNKHVQDKLRSELRSRFDAEAKAGILPSALDIVTSDLPYLEAVIQENHRVGLTSPAALRRATVDTEILGHRIPKGTDVWFLNQTYNKVTPMKVDSSLRNKYSQALKEQIPIWDDSDIEEFKPERWLETDSDGKLHFNSQAGPSLPFGLGLRACFGRRLAIQSLKINIALVVWSFELLSVPPELSSYAAIDGLTRAPQMTYIKLRSVE